MKTAKRTPIEPDEVFAKALERSRRTGDKLTADGITITPPKVKNGHWRLRFTFNNRSSERKAKDSLPEVNSAFISIYSELRSLQLGTLGLPEFSEENLAEVISRYISQGGPNSLWRGKTPKNRSEDFNVLKNIARKEKILCKDFNASLMRRFLAQATNSGKRAKGIIGVVKTFVRWGISTGYFTQKQYEEISTVTWMPPKNSNYKIAPTRREQSRIYFGTDDRAGGQVPTHEQVIELANELQELYVHGKGLIYVSANLGTRGNETLIYTADKAVFDNGLGNFVDLKEEVVRVHWQFSNALEKSERITKNNKFRAVVIPPLESVATGFDVYGWLSERSEKALFEQSIGENPFAYIFPNSDGGALNLHYLHTKMMSKALEALGWKMPAYFDAQGKPKHMFRFTLHSLRDRFGTTAADEWGYSERQLLEQGSWTDPETVRKFYLGTTDSTHETVKALHRSRKVDLTKFEALHLFNRPSINS